LERGFTQSECALIRDLDEETVLQHATQAARDGHRVPLNAFLPDDLIESLKEIVRANPNGDLLNLSGDLPDGLSAMHVELYMLERDRPDEG
jgi:hypothetical protein